jgi:protocatechuate 3,4-dioxygenase beta subunit
VKFDPVSPTSQPALIYAPYVSTTYRGPKHPPVSIAAPPGVMKAVPVVESRIGGACDLTVHGAGQPAGQRIVVTGRVRDEDGRPVRRSLIEVWQCNAAGRYTHRDDQHHAPLDPNFEGEGHMLTDDEGRYRFVTIHPGAYPWSNSGTIAWRPSHIHFSLFGHVYPQRLVTQMYFPGDPLLDYDVIWNSIPDEAARRALIARFSLEETVGDEALGFVFDIVVRGRDATPFGL